MGKLQDQMDRELRIRGYAENTRINYLRAMRALVRHFMRSPDELSLEHVKQYQLFLTKEKRVSWSMFNLHVSAIRFFYREVVEVDWDVERISYHKRAKRLPVILSGEEICALLHTTENPKHRALLMTLYAAGLRCSEATHLQLGSIDSGRMMIRVDQGKGRKDRYVMLSQRLLLTLRRYWKAYRPDPWLFPGKDPTRPLCIHSVGSLFAHARNRAGIQKRVTPHSLRHSFATHLLERGVNIRVIQRLLGHRSLRSTEIYMHVAQGYVRDTRSPLDDLLPDLGDREGEQGEQED